MRRAKKSECGYSLLLDDPEVVDELPLEEAPEAGVLDEPEPEEPVPEELVPDEPDPDELPLSADFDDPLSELLPESPDFESPELESPDLLLEFFVAAPLPP
jgi:hypothetical protein